MHPYCLVYYDKTWMTVLTCFTKNDCWAAIPDPIWMINVNEIKINMLSSIYNNFMICLFDFERFSIESRFSFVLIHPVYYRYTSFVYCVNSQLYLDIFGSRCIFENEKKKCTRRGKHLGFFAHHFFLLPFIISMFRMQSWFYIIYFPYTT